MSLVRRTYRSKYEVDFVQRTESRRGRSSPVAAGLGGFNLWVRRTFRPRGKRTLRYAGELTAARLVLHIDGPLHAYLPAGDVSPARRCPVEAASRRLLRI